MFDVHFFSKPSAALWPKNNFTPMGLNPYRVSAAGSPPGVQTGPEESWFGFVIWCPAAYL